LELNRVGIAGHLRYSLRLDLACATFTIKPWAK